MDIRNCLQGVCGVVGWVVQVVKVEETATGIIHIIPSGTVLDVTMKSCLVISSLNVGRE